MKAESNSIHSITAEIQRDADGKPKAFLLKHDKERIALEPGKAWTQLDSFKWVNRGLIDEPRGFHVLSDGSVDIHGEHIQLGEPDSAHRLEERITEHFEVLPPHPARPQAPAHHQPKAVLGLKKVLFKVRVDKLGHLMVACFRLGERTEAGIRGIEGLIHEGLMLKPAHIHLDPLLRYVEIDDARFESSPAGAQALEACLNDHYSPEIKENGAAAIEIKANVAAASGFDIHFFTVRAGARFEVRTHLSQDSLDVLQDHVKCQLLRPEILLRLSPPHLIIRRRRHDGGEEKIPELPDIHYLHVSAAELQRIFNHPLIRRTAPGASLEPEAAPQPASSDVLELRVSRSSEKRLFLDLEVVRADKTLTRAFTHHNVAELQHAGAFRPDLEVALSLDGHTLTVLRLGSGERHLLEIHADSPDAILDEATELLTMALRPPQNPFATTSSPPAPQKLNTAAPEPAPVSIAAATPAPVPAQCPPAAPPPAPEPAIIAPPLINPELDALFAESDPVQTNLQTFRRLEACLGLQKQSVRISLEWVFNDRHFEILSFTHPNVSDLLEIRSNDFIGFYLTHINEHRVLLDYAHLGKRIEWGPDKACLQTSVTADPEEFSGRALLGMALLDQNRFGFVVTPAFKRWVQPREALYGSKTGIRFITVEDVAAAPEQYPLVWPLP